MPTENDGVMIVLSSPSGAGKTTLVKSLIKRNKNIKYSISYTTRAPRKNEKNGIDYFFVTVNEFNKLKIKFLLNLNSSTM